MYIFEIIAKILRDRKIRKLTSEETVTEDNNENCKHIYLAIDSTKDYLACYNCGHVIKNENKPNKKKNIFEI